MRIAMIVACLGLSGLSLVSVASGVQEPVIDVYKSPTCGCCVKWVAHLEQHGFTVRTMDVPDPSAVKSRVGVPGRLTSCHTALVDGYIVEGHVPATDVRRMLEKRPPIAGLTVPGMPVGSPGMEGPNPKPYDVLTFDLSGKITVFSSHRP